MQTSTPTPCASSTASPTYSSSSRAMPRVRRPSRRGRGASRSALHRRRLISSLVDKEGSDGAGQKHQIKPHGPVAHVVDIHLDPVSEESVVAPGNLPRSGYPWRYAQNLVTRVTDFAGLTG